MQIFLKKNGIFLKIDMFLLKIVHKNEDFHKPSFRKQVLYNRLGLALYGTAKVRQKIIKCKRFPYFIKN